MTYLAEKIVYPVWDFKDRSDRMAEFGRLQRTQWAPADTLHALRSDRLRRLLDHAFATVPFYRDAWMQQPDVSNIDDLSRLPIVGKDDIRRAGPGLLSSARESTKIVSAKTGGSTGKSLVLFFDEHCQQWRNAAAMRSDWWAGWRPGTWTGALWGTPPVPRTPKERFRNYWHDRYIYLDTMAMNEGSMQALAERLRRLPRYALFGHAHSLYVFACWIADAGIDLARPQAIIATSMMLLEPERRRIEQAFGTSVSNRYGCEEVGLIASECEHRNGLHVNAEHVIVEILDESGQEVGDGEEGDIVVTDLVNRAMPLIRYRIEDRGVLTRRKCDCGRNLPIIERIVGRRADMLRRADGTSVAGVSLVEKTVTEIEGIEQMQIVQCRLREFELRVVPNESFGESQARALRAVITSSFGNNVNARVVTMDSLPQEDNGKYRFAICTLDGDPGAV